MKQLPEIEKIDSKKEVSCQKRTIYNGRRKSVNFKADTDNLNIVAYRYRNNLYPNNNEIVVKLTEYQSLLVKRVYQLSYSDLFFNRCIVLDETTVHKENNHRQEWMFSF